MIAGPFGVAAAGELALVVAGLLPLDALELLELLELLPQADNNAVIVTHAITILTVWPNLWNFMSLL